MRQSTNFRTVACVFAGLAGIASAQKPVPADITALISPEVHPDRTVTFRLFAPKASEVAVAGEWMTANNAETAVRGEAMKKDEKGVWSTTIGPLAANTYTYNFKVDGMNIADPVNPLIKLRARTSANLVNIPGNQPWEYRDVPHGAVEINYHTSAVLNGAMRQVFVYTPPGYYNNTTIQYPILYLLHGNGGVASDWSLTGSANCIEDNFVAESKAVPMIIVMPWGHALPFGSPVPVDPERSNDALFEQYLLNEVIPLAESKYRVAPGRINRAIAGLSMGGAQAAQVGYGHPDLFASVGVFSSGLFRSGLKEHGESRYRVLNDPALANAEMKVLFFGVGKEDTVRKAELERLTASLSKHGIKYVFYETQTGGHNWPVWRRCLMQFLPLLFQKTSSHTAGSEPGIRKEQPRSTNTFSRGSKSLNA